MHKEKKFVNLANDVVIFGLGIVLAKAIQFFLMPLYTSYLSEAEYGRGELVNNLSDLLLPIATLNLYEAGFRYIADENKDKKEIYSTITRLFCLSAILGLLISIICSCILNNMYAEYLYIDLYGYSAMWILSYLAKGKGDSKAFALSGVLNAIFLFLLAYLFIVIFEMRDVGYIMAISLAYVPACVFLLIHNKTYQYITLSAYNKECAVTLLRYGIPLVVYNIGYWLVTVSGRYILLLFKGESEVGIYVSAMKISTIMNMVYQACNAAFQLNAIKQFKERDHEAFYSHAFIVFESLFFFMASLLIILTPILSQFLLKKNFFKAETYLPIIILSATIYAISTLYGMMYSVYIKPVRTIPCIFASAFINIILAFMLTDNLGIYGICISSIFAYTFQVVYRIIDVRSFSNVKINWILLIILFCLLGLELLGIMMGNNLLFPILICTIILTVSVVRILRIVIYFLR